MKKTSFKLVTHNFLIFIICLVFTNMQSEAQTPIVLTWDNSIKINFNDLDNRQYVKLDTNNFWVIDDASKYKSVLSVYGISIFTDTNTYYSNNINSSFTIKLITNHIDFDVFNFQFKHKYDFEKNKDGGIIETSYDNGQTWQNIIFDTITTNSQLYYNQFMGYYSMNDTIASYNNQPGFTGTDTVFKTVYVSFTTGYIILYDTVLFRFTISTDSVSSLNEGWIIDDILFNGLLVNINEIKDNNTIHIFPNPSHNTITIEILDIQDAIEEIEIYNMLGQLMLKQNSWNKTTIDISSFPQGLYVLKAKTENGICVKKFVKE